MGKERTWIDLLTNVVSDSESTTGSTTTGCSTQNPLEPNGEENKDGANNTCLPEPSYLRLEELCGKPVPTVEYL